MDPKDKDKDKETKGDEKEVKDKEEKVEAIADRLADKLADKLAEAIVARKGGEEADKDDLSKKILSPQLSMATAYPSDLTNLTKDEKIVLFFKSLVMRGKDPSNLEHDKVFKALIEGTDAEGGYLVPDELRAEVFRILPDVSIMRRIARVIPMASDTLLLTSLAARPSAYWTSEYASKTTSSAEFGRTTLTANDLVCLLPVSHQLLADANINVAQFIIELFAEAIGLAEDTAFFTGSGTGRPRGINQETLTSVNALNSVSFDDVIALIDSVPQRITQSPRAAFVGHRYAKRILRQLKDSNNNYIWRDGGAAGNNAGETRRLPDTLYGYAFHEQNDLAQTELYFGDWSFYIIGDRQQLTVSSTDVGGDAWRRNSTEIKAVERVDGRAVVTGAFAKITNLK